MHIRVTPTPDSHNTFTPCHCWYDHHLKRQLGDLYEVVPRPNPVFQGALRDHLTLVLVGNLESWMPSIVDLLRKIHRQAADQGTPTTHRLINGTQLMDAAFGERKSRPDSGPYAHVPPEIPQPGGLNALQSVGILVIDLGTCQNNKRLGDILAYLLPQRVQNRKMTWVVCPHTDDDLDRLFSKAIDPPIREVLAALDRIELPG